MPQNPIAAVEEFTRAAVRDVFNKMLRLEVKDDQAPALAPESAGHIIGSVGFIGRATGIVYLSAGVGLARVVTGNMLGITETEMDDGMINDAFGELSNMVVGSVKSRLSDSGWPCVLTIPSIVRVNGMQIESAADAKRGFFAFRTAERQLIIEIAVKVPQS